MSEEWGYRLRRFWWGHFSPGVRLTTLIVWSNVAVFAVQLFFHYGLRSERVDDLFALFPGDLDAGRYWRLVTYAWLHSTTLFLHILFNMTMVYSLGRELEWPLGTVRFLTLYFGSLIAAALVWLVWDGRTDAGVEGASGAVFGLLAAYGCYDPQRVLRVWIMLLIPVTMRARTLALTIVGFEVVCQFTGWLSGIAHSAHLGGALFGFLFMKFWHPAKPAPVHTDSFSKEPQNRPDSTP